MDAFAIDTNLLIGGVDIFSTILVGDTSATFVRNEIRGAAECEIYFF